jgi:imidazolonepropionase-like amidohydrolase
MKKVVLLVAVFLPSLTLAQSYLIENVRIFNGVDPELTAGHVLVEDGVITAVSEGSITPSESATVIDGGGRVLSPGFIDLHVHLTSHVPSKLGDSHTTVVGAVANDVARHFLDSGFTTIRDAGGTHPDLARAIEAGVVYGPRVFPSGAILSQTGGHGDWRHPSAPHPMLESGSPYTDSDTGVLVDGVDQHLAAARENLRRGATQIKIMGTTTRSTRCNRLRRRYAPRCRRPATGEPTCWPMLTRVKQSAASWKTVSAASSTVC